MYLLLCIVYGVLIKWQALGIEKKLGQIPAPFSLHTRVVTGNEHIKKDIISDNAKKGVMCGSNISSWARL